MDPVVSAALISVLGALGGAYLGARGNEQAGRISRLEERTKRYRAEIRARMAVEDVACAWLVERGEAKTERAAMLKLRERAEQAHGVRPMVRPAEVVDDE